MSPARSAIILTLLLALVVGAIALFSEQPMTLTRPAVRSAVPEPRKRTFDGPKKTVVLFFASQDGRLLQEEIREIVGGATITEDARRTLEELLRGPEGDLVPTLPRSVQIRNVFIERSGTTYIDFDRELREGYREGIQAEQCAVFSIVDTLVTNYPEIKRVQLLVEGVEIPTLRGGVDTGMPLSPRYVF